MASRVVPIVISVVAAGTLAVGGCSVSGSDVGARPESTSAAIADARTPSPVPTASPPPTPVPASTPAPPPIAAELVAAKGEDRGTITLSIHPEGLAPVEFEGRFAPGAVELTFDFAEFVELVKLSDAALASDPLIAEAGEVLGGPWTVRLVDGVIYVQQPTLVEAAGGTEGGWVLVDDPGISELLTSSGILGGGLDHQTMTEVIRAAVGPMSPSSIDGLAGGEVDSSFDGVLDGALLTAGGRSPADTASFMGLDGLHSVSTPVMVGLLVDSVSEADQLVMVALDVPAGGFGPESVPTRVEISYGELGEQLRIQVPSAVTSADSEPTDE